MSDLTPMLAPQFIKPEMSTEDLLYQILIELKKINSQLILITDIVIREQDILNEKEEIGP